MAQINPRVGDITGNSAKIIEYTRLAAARKADIVLFPELAVTGYPPEDLLLKPGFLRQGMRAVAEITAATREIVSVVGFVDKSGEKIYNAAAVIQNGKIADVHHKALLPNYGVFDEDRYFQRGLKSQVFNFGGVRFGVNICEDIWFSDGPALLQSAIGGAELILVINASPYHRGKWRNREQMLGKRAVDNACVICYLNTVGGQDELVFDGMSVVMGRDGGVLARAKAFEEDLLVADVDVSVAQQDVLGRKDECGVTPEGANVPVVDLLGGPQRVNPEPSVIIEPPNDLEEVYQALVLGTRDYVRKNGFEEVVIGLSGGIDSALTLTVACDALGSDNVVGVSMPGRFSSLGTRSDAKRIAENLGIRFLTLPIGDVFTAYETLLAEPFLGRGPDLTEENLQSRIRGNLLMALSNKFGYMVLTTGNKSEIACGYATIYGDMAGGFAVLKDVPKTLVWQLAEYRNRDGEIIPWSTIQRPPSAELRENQKDSDSLPPYNVLDPILVEYVELDKSLPEIVALGYEEATVRRIINLVDQSEYKRRQGAPGVKITPKAFGKDRRLPITNAFRDW